MTDVLVIGAGPAGMSAAIRLQAHGLAVTVVDDQPAPGGRIFTAIETRRPHGTDDRWGADLVARFRAQGGEYLPATEVWQIDRGPRVFLSNEGQARMVDPRFVLLATGAQERPMAFEGWQLPGVMTVGGAQILLKAAREIPQEPVWLAGSGPLLLLYARQLMQAGGRIAGILDTSPEGSVRHAAPHLPEALGYGWRDLARGLGWILCMRGITVVRRVSTIEAVGEERLESVRYKTRDGTSGEVRTGLLFVHDGVVPGVHTTMSAGCAHRWNRVQQTFEPILDRFGASSDPTIYVAGDGATIAGARAATLSGQLAAIGITQAAGLVHEEAAEKLARPLRRKLKSAAGFRRFIDALYPPASLTLADGTLVCRCEEVTARQVRDVLTGRPNLGPDGIKADTRAGMGPCQGRQCGLTLTRLVAETHGQSPEQIGFLRIRPPLKPLTLVELAGLETAC